MFRFDKTDERGSSEMSDQIKTQIANHPTYPHLVAAYIECQQVGAPPEMASLLQEISRENRAAGGCSGQIGADPELNHFMESYCEILHMLKEELSKPFNEATTFLTSIESQLSNLCQGTFSNILDCPSETGESEVIRDNRKPSRHMSFALMDAITTASNDAAPAPPDDVTYI